MKNEMSQILGGSVFANGLGDWVSIPGRIIRKTLKNGTWYLCCGADKRVGPANNFMGNNACECV